ncbi:MAG: hypothetical protein K2X86_08350 [Cytophagaceae bacterium]|nr:hypothetical protein [Cytophagaceae bacterium]
MDELKRFKEIFWDAFHKPKLETEKFLEVWEGLEPVNDMLAGPFYCICSNDQCDYVFKDKARFPSIYINQFIKYERY